MDWGDEVEIAWLEFDGTMCTYGHNCRWVCIFGGVLVGIDVGILGKRKEMSVYTFSGEISCECALQNNPRAGVQCGEDIDRAIKFMGFLLNGKEEEGTFLL